ncbi:MAG: NAD(P)-binding protein [Gammaproteobacteria bacterium]
MTRIAVIGAGISGLSVCYLLSKHSEFHIDLYEKENRLGGHTHTHELEVKGDEVRVDSGFIVFNHINYPNLTRLFEELNVEINNSSMSFSYCTSNSAWSSQDYKNLSFVIKKSSLKRMFEIIRFKKLALSNKKRITSQSLGDWLFANNFSSEFVNEYVLPMSSSIWSSHFDVIKDFPFETFVSFFDNHQLFNLVSRPQWKSLDNGSDQYIKKMQSAWKVNSVFLDANPQISRTENFCITNQGKSYEYDKIIFGCHANQINQVFPEINNILDSQVLNKFKYTDNPISIHTDLDVMPKNRKQWSSWNVQNINDKFFLTYWMNNLQRLNTKHDIFISVGEHSRISKQKMIKAFNYQHPIYSSESIKAQHDLDALQGKAGIYYVGAYLGYGFHEDGLNSAIRVSNLIKEALGVF